MKREQEIMVEETKKEIWEAKEEEEEEARGTKREVE